MFSPVHTSCECEANFDVTWLFSPVFKYKSCIRTALSDWPKGQISCLQFATATSTFLSKCVRKTSLKKASSVSSSCIYWRTLTHPFEDEVITRVNSLSFQRGWRFSNIEAFKELLSEIDWSYHLALHNHRLPSRSKSLPRSETNEGSPNVNVSILSQSWSKLSFFCQS